MRKQLWLTVLVLGLIPGVARADVQCDGIDDLLSTALTLASFTTASAFTIMGYVKSTGSSFGETECWSSGPFLMDSNEVLAVGRSQSTEACVMVYTGPATVARGTMSAGWHHVAARLAAGTLEVFVDGASAGSVASGGINTLDGSTHLCGQADGHSPDRITDVKTYNSAVSSAEIERIGKSRRRRVERTTPTAYWPLQDCSEGASGTGLPFRDRSGNNRDLTGDAGANTTGLTCRASEFVSRPWGVQ